MGPLQGEVALVTGASGGLGADLARALARAGAQVVLAARSEVRLATLAGQLGCGFARCDVTVADDRSRLIDTVLERHGRLDVLVNNAGTSHPSPAEEESEDAFRALLELNLVAPFALARLAARSMLDRGRGSIINVASVLGLVGLGRIPDASYAASKGGLVNLTRELAAQWSPRGIRVNAIAPGFFPSPLTGEWLDSESGRRWVAGRTLLGRAGRPGELDGVLVLLASDAGSYITGQVIAVDGGWTAV